MNYKNQCILCGTTNDLNTGMELAVEEGKVAVALCAACSEEATVKKVREAYLVKQVEIKEFLAKAKSLGFDLSQASSGLAVVTAPAQSAPSQPRPLPPGITPVLEGEDVMDTSFVDNRRMVSVGGQAQHISGMIQVPAHASHDPHTLKEQLPDGARRGRVQMSVVRGRCGQPVALPTTRVDGCGTTRVRVVETSDVDLQRRAKNLQERSQAVEAWNRPCFRDGYEEVERTVRCSLCRGQCTIIHQGRMQTCPKCNGIGVLTH